MDKPIVRLFAYENSYREDLHFMPISMRFRLDGAGLKIGLDTWLLLPVPLRFELAGMPATAEKDIADFGGRLAMVLASIPGAQAPAPVDVDPTEWGAQSPLPECIRRICESLGIPMSDRLWMALDALERYALVKLSRSKRQPEAFLMVWEEVSSRLPLEME